MLMRSHDHETRKKNRSVPLLNSLQLVCLDVGYGCSNSPHIS